MTWKYKRIIQELREVQRFEYWHTPKDSVIKKIRIFASKYFKDTWRQELSCFDYDLEQLREFADLIDWEKWYLWKGRNVPIYILGEFKHKCKYMQEDWEKAEKKFGVQYMRDMKKK